MTRTPSKQDAAARLGARPVVADALDADAVARAVAEAEPDVIVHQLTALSGRLDMRHFDRDVRADQPPAHRGHRPPARRRARRRRPALRRAELRRLAVRAHAAGPVKTEDDPLDPEPPAALRATLDAIRHVERAVTAIDWARRRRAALRRLLRARAPALSSDAGAEMVEPIRKRKFPVVGDGAGVWSFIHIDDAAAATVAAVEHGTTGHLQGRRRRARAGRASGCRRWRARWAPSRRAACRAGSAGSLAGEAVTVMMTEVRGASNAKAKRELGWQPRYASWRQGFAEGLG